MGKILSIAMIVPAFLAAQSFDVASVKTNPPQPGFHFSSDSLTGGPGTGDPGMFRCSKCSLATLIVKAFNLQPYQFPGKASLNDNTYDIQATIPADTTPEQFSVMLQNLLKERFGLVYHFDEKKMKGYHLVVAKNGSKLKESTDGSLPPPGDHGGRGGGESHAHSGVMAFGTSSSYRAANQTMPDLARIVSDQIGVPVDDETGLKGKYDISLRWTGSAAKPVVHSDTGGGGFAGHGGGGHDSGGGAPGGPVGDSSGPTIFEALQQQLGLRLAPAEQALARLFVIDKVAPKASEN